MLPAADDKVTARYLNVPFWNTVAPASDSITGCLAEEDA